MPLFLAGVALGTVGVRVVTGSAPPIAVLAVAALVGMLLTDLTTIPGQPLRDLGIYVKAGQHFAAGQPVYSDRLLTAVPVDRTEYPYLYPPFTLPFAALIAAIPSPLVDVLWLGLSVAAAMLTFRLVGIRPRWWLPLLAWPPVFQGLFVGNVAVFMALLFAAAPWAGAGLVVAGAFKVYSGIAALWLVRERRWRAIAVGVAILAGLALLTLPLTGIDQWRAWIGGLRAFRDSQPLLRDVLYGVGLPRYLPEVVALGLAAVAVGFAWFARRGEGLARFGVATIVASPSLYAHGLIVGLPAFASLRLRWAWLAIAITSVVPGVSWWAAIGLVAASWLLLVLRRPALPIPDDASEGRGGEVAAWDLLGIAPHPWPEAEGFGPPAPDRAEAA